MDELIDGTDDIIEIFDSKSTAVQSAKEKRVIAHYTSLQTLLLILKSRYIKLNRIDKLNDPMESKYIGKSKG